MSYILDALRKSEIERKQGNVPGLQTEQVFHGNNEQKKPWWKYAFIIVIFINLGLVANWYYTEQQEKITFDNQFEMNAKTIPDSDMNVSTPSRSAGGPNAMQANKLLHREQTVVSQQEKTIPQKTALNSTKIAGVSAKQDVSEMLSVSEEKSPESIQTSPEIIEEQVAQPKAKKVVVAELNAESPEDFIAHVSKKSMEALKKKESKSTLDPRNNPPVILKKPPVVEHDPRTILRISQLPDSVQRALPDLSYSGHIFSSNPVRRKLVINGRSMSEGEWVTNNLQLDEITIDGAIFSYKEYYYQIELLRNWSVN